MCENSLVISISWSVFSDRYASCADGHSDIHHHDLAASLNPIEVDEGGHPIPAFRPPGRCSQTRLRARTPNISTHPSTRPTAISSTEELCHRSAETVFDSRNAGRYHAVPECEGVTEPGTAARRARRRRTGGGLTAGRQLGQASARQQASASRSGIAEAILNWSINSTTSDAGESILLFRSIANRAGKSVKGRTVRAARW